MRYLHLADIIGLNIFLIPAEKFWRRDQSPERCANDRYAG